MYEMEDFGRQKGWKLLAKSRSLWQGTLGDSRIYQKGYLTCANQVISDWLKIPLLERLKLIKLGIKSWLGDVDLAEMTPFGTCCLF